jgi:hypothetical protein
MLGTTSIFKLPPYIFMSDANSAQGLYLLPYVPKYYILELSFFIIHKTNISLCCL